MARRLSLLVLLASALLPRGSATAELIVGSDVRLTPVAFYTAPVEMAARPGEDALYIVEKIGLIHAIRGGVPDPVPVLNVTTDVLTVSTSTEQGLLGLAFSPDGARMYVHLTDGAGDTRILEFAVDAAGRAVTSSRRQVLFLDQPYVNHYGGHLAFGPDGYLYAALGDGGDAGDPLGNGQNLGSLSGKIIRIDPTPTSTAPYRVPASNPFIGVAGARPEIWAYGLRNPWKFSFDRAAGDLWIVDVGQDSWEEVNLQRGSAGGGQNYGWNQMEGTHTYKNGHEPANHTRPVHEYAHATGACAIIGGYVYRGGRIPSLRGKYVYSDWCGGTIRALREQGGVVISDDDLGLDVPQISSFGEDRNGELYALSLAGSIFRFDPPLQ